VVVDSEGLTVDAMQRFANWTNLSETAFLLPPTHPAADYKVRIFTPAAELPFAGHPTLGSCHAWLSHGGMPRQARQVVQECGVGLVTIRQGEDGELAFAAPPLLRHGPVGTAELDEAVAALGIRRADVVAAAWVDNGPGWMGLLLSSAADVLALRPQAMQLKLGVAGPYPAGSPFAYEVRAFYSEGGMTFEDPVTGSLNASLAQWFIGSGRFSAPYTVSQGTVLGRAGRVRIATDATGAVWVGGDVVACVAGTVEL
jgi:PhzF family phenazine biosynthesis protein